MPKAKHSPGSVLCYTAGRSASSSRVLCPLLPATLMNLVPKVHISAPVANASPWPTSFRGSAGPLGAELTPEDILMWILTLAANNYSTETWQGPFPGPALDSHCVCSSLTLLPGWMRREGLAMRAGQRCGVCVWPALLRLHPGKMRMASGCPATSQWFWGWTKLKKKTSSRTCWVQLAG